MKTINYLLVLLALIFAGCSGNNPSSSSDEHLSSIGTSSNTGISSINGTSSSSISVVPEMSTPAQSSSATQSGVSSITDGSSSSVGTSSAVPPIALFKMRGLAKVANIVTEMTPIEYDVDLDTITTTASVYFMIKNNSKSTITGLKFAFDKPYFKITPDSVITLGTPSNETGVEQLIKVTIEHGTLASGLGVTDLLTGNQYGNLTISGTNADGDFSVSYSMHVFAKRMVAYIDYPDSIYVNGSVTLYGVTYTNQAPISVMKDHTTATDFASLYGYVYADNASNGCYVDFSTGVSIDNSTTKVVRSEHYMDGNGYVIADSASSYALYQKEKSITGLIQKKTSFDFNCVTLIIDKINGTQAVYK